MALKTSKSRKTSTLQQNTFKGLGSRTCRIDPVNRQSFKVAQQKEHRTFLCAEYFYFHEQHLFSCVNPLLLCYRMLNMDRIAIFFFSLSFLRLWSKKSYKMKFWQCCDFIIPYKILWDWFSKQAVHLLKFGTFSRSKMLRNKPANRQHLAWRRRILWRHHDVTLWKTTLTSKEQIYINALCRVRS